MQQESTIVTAVPHAVTPKDPSYALIVQVMDEVLSKKRTTGNIKVPLLTFYFSIYVFFFSFFYRGRAAVFF